MSTQWVRIRTPDSGRIYYHNPDLNSTVWSLPKGDSCKDETAISPKEGVNQGMRRESLEQPTKESTDDATQLDKVIRTAQTTQRAAKKFKELREKRSQTQEGAEKKAMSIKIRTPIQPPSGAGEKTVRAGEKTVNGGSNSMMSNPSLGAGGDQQSESKQAQQQHQQLNVKTPSGTSKKGKNKKKKKKKKKKMKSRCAHVDPRNVSFTVYLMWLIPVLIMVSINIYYFQIIELWGDIQRPGKYQNKTKPLKFIWPKDGKTYENMRLIQLNTGHDAALAYAQANYKYISTKELRKLTPPSTCQNHFIEQAGTSTEQLCHGYCTGCILGGNTAVYPYLPLILAGLWTGGVILSGIFLPIIASLWNQKKSGGGAAEENSTSNLTMRDARVFMLLLLTFLVFGVMIYLIHHARVIDVPQGHSMYTFWIFFTCYYFGTSSIYWSRLDVSPIKNRQPELSLGVAFLGYCYVTHIVGAYYLTGVQAWPCIISMIVAYVITPAYFLSFIRRGLELWATHRHHKSVLKRMKQEELKTLLALDDAGEGSYVLCCSVMVLFV